MIHRGNGKSHPAPIGTSRIEYSVPMIEPPAHQDLRYKVEDWIAAHPIASIAAAAAAGAVLGWMIKGR